MIYNHFIKPYCYIIWHKKEILGEVAEDSIMSILNKNQLVDFYHLGRNKFTVEANKLNFINDK